MKKTTQWVFVAAIMVICTVFVGIAADNSETTPFVVKAVKSDNNTGPSESTIKAITPATTPEELIYEPVPFKEGDIAKSELVIHGEGFDLVPMTNSEWEIKQKGFILADWELVTTDQKVLTTVKGPILTKRGEKIEVTATLKKGGVRIWVPADKDHSMPDRFYVAVKRGPEKQAMLPGR